MTLQEVSPPPAVTPKTLAKRCIAEDDILANVKGVTQKRRKGAESQEALEVQFAEKDQEGNKEAWGMASFEETSIETLASNLKALTVRLSGELAIVTAAIANHILA